MALPIQDQLKALLQDTVKKPQLIVEIDGLPAFSSIPSQKYAVYGDPIAFGDVGLVYGGLITDASVLPYIDLSKSTNQITQQMLVDKGGFSSVTSFDIALVDKDQLITQLITPSYTIDDIISRKARLYLSVEGAGHPRDSVLFFAGIVAGVSSGAGTVSINVASPEKLKNLEIFPKLSTNLTIAALSTDTTVTVKSTEHFLIPADAGTLTTYLLLNNEIIKYTGITATTFTGLSRGQFGTIAVDHAINDGLESAYRLIGNLRDLSLKLMLSGLNTPYVVDEPVLSFNFYGDVAKANSIFVARYNIDQYYGIVAGDTLTVTGASNASNNGSAIVQAIQSTAVGSYIVLGKTFINETLGATFSITSKYAVLPKFAGLEMTPDQVDVSEFEKKYSQFSASFFDYDFFIKDPVNGSEFINTEILYPSGAYALPRKAKTSIGLTIPPLAQSGTKKLDATNVTGAGSIRINRNISRFFYNAVVYKYEKDQVDDKFKAGKIRQSASSTSRIKIANKPLTIESAGIRSSTNFDGKLTIQTRRFLERYQYAAESLDLMVNFETGFDIEIGDSVILDGSGLQISDTKSAQGSRDFQPRLFEVQNKSLAISGKPVKLSLVDTAFSLNGRYGVVSPSSKVDVGSTTTTLRLKKSYGTILGYSSEGNKWRNFIGQRVRVRSVDYVFDQEVTLSAIDPANDDGIIVTPDLTSAPTENYIVDICKYPANTNAEDQALYKSIFVFADNQIQVATGISQTQFTVSNAALLDIAVGYQVKIHDKTYSRISAVVNVLSIVANTVTVNAVLGFVPILGDKIELLGFMDNGKPYLIL